MRTHGRGGKGCVSRLATLEIQARLTATGEEYRSTRLSAAQQRSRWGDRRTMGPTNKTAAGRPLLERRRHTASAEFEDDRLGGAAGSGGVIGQLVCRRRAPSARRPRRPYRCFLQAAPSSRSAVLSPTFDGVARFRAALRCAPRAARCSSV